MMPNLGHFDSEKGGGFRETVRYALAMHSEKTQDEIAAGQAHLINTDRVALVRVIGIDAGDLDADRIADAMQDVADRADELKRAAGISTRGRKATTSPVFHFSMRDHPDAAAMTDDEWLTFLAGAVKSLDLPDGHQVMIAKHVEPQRPNWPDWHVVVNKVSAVDGTRWNPMNAQQKLQSYADDFDRQRGYNFTPERREKIDRVRDWAAKEPDPKKRDRTKRLHPPKEKISRNYKAEKTLAAIEREGLPMTPAIAALIDRQLEADRTAMRRYGSKKRIAELERLAKHKRKQAWERLQAAKKLADLPSSTLKDRAGDIWARVAKSVSWAGYRRRAPAKRAALDAQIKMRYRAFYRNERSIFGPLFSARAVMAEAKKRGMERPALKALAADPAARKALFDAINQHDRQQLKRELAAERGRIAAYCQTLNRAAVQKQEARAEYVRTLAEIDDWLKRRTTEAVEEWDKTQALSRTGWGGILTVARREGEKIRMEAAAKVQQRLEQQRRAAAIRDRLADQEQEPDEIERDRSRDRGRDGRPKW